MGGKKKGGKKGKKKKKGDDEEDTESPLYLELIQLTGEQLELRAAKLHEDLRTQRERRNMLQMEKDMIHDFYHNTRSEIKEIDAKIANFDTDMQSMEDAHKT